MKKSAEFNDRLCWGERVVKTGLGGGGGGGEGSVLKSFFLFLSDNDKNKVFFSFQTSAFVCARARVCVFVCECVFVCV